MPHTFFTFICARYPRAGTRQRILAKAYSLKRRPKSIFFDPENPMHPREKSACGMLGGWRTKKRKLAFYY